MNKKPHKVPAALNPQPTLSDNSLFHKPPQPGQSRDKTRIKKLVIPLLAIIATLLFPHGEAFAKNEPPDQKLQRRVMKMERYLYGETREGGLDQRLRDLEIALLGHPTSRRTAAKTANTYDLLFRGTEKSPSLDMKLNFLEWKVFDATHEGPMGERLARLDRQITGGLSEEPLAFRIDQLLHYIVEGGVISLHRVKLPKGTTIKLKLGRTLSTKSARTGDEVPFTIVSDLFLENNILAIGKGGLLSGELEKVKRGSRFGRSGYMKLAISEIEAIDSTAIPVRILGIGDDEINKKKMGLAIGASAVGYLLMGPVGLVGGAFVKGKDVEVEKGTVIIVRTAADCYINGILIRRK